MSQAAEHKLASVIIGIDPGLRHTGWGVVRVTGTHLHYVAAGVISPMIAPSMATRLAQLASALAATLQEYQPSVAAVEETFVNGNARSALQLGQARGIALLMPAQAGLPVHEYAANVIKKTVTGYGHADKQQIERMVKLLLLNVPDNLAPDAADALAIAICHAHHCS